MVIIVLFCMSMHVQLFFFKYNFICTFIVHLVQFCSFIYMHCTLYMSMHLYLHCLPCTILFSSDFGKENFCVTTIRYVIRIKFKIRTKRSPLTK